MLKDTAELPDIVIIGSENEAANGDREGGRERADVVLLGARDKHSAERYLRALRGDFPWSKLQLALENEQSSCRALNEAWPRRGPTVAVPCKLHARLFVCFADPSGPL